ncbi:single-stranded-DNA-specific exonuclease [Alteromonadaceae bacterium Bs31]|nr:single-stranded-DNA-specific exonuclease [Alteromonadaceae bacterium Bs31]
MSAGVFCSGSSLFPYKFPWLPHKLDLYMIKKITRRTALPAAEAVFHSLPAIIQRVLSNRKISNAEQIDYQLAKLQHPQSLKGLDTAIGLLYGALQQQQRVCILGDFDADGATSTALAVRCLRAFGLKQVEYLVPNRFEYGYGLTPEIVDVIAGLQPQLIVTVDNGIASIDGVAAAKSYGMKVLVTDHHLPGRHLPDADAIVNPNQHYCEFGSKNLAGVGVIFYVMNALRAHLRRENWFQAQQLKEPNMAEFLDLVSLGTVADVVPLDHNNRILVEQGLRRMRAGACCNGIRALFEVGGRDLSKLSSSDLGFVAGPRLNAAGRLDDMSLGIRCLLADSYREARHIAAELDALNRERRSIEASMQQEAQSFLEDILRGEQEWPQAICLYKDDWHPGVIGILASRVKERTHRPTIVFADNGDGSIKGSGRSIEGVHLRDALDRVATQHPGLLDKFGGHAMAAGLSLAGQHFQQFNSAFVSVIDELLNGQAPEAELLTDGELQLEDFSLSNALAIQNLGPWGQAFPEPCFDGEFRILTQRIVGEKHLKLLLTPSEYSGFSIDAIAFNVDGDIWPNADIQKVRLVYKLNCNEYRGEQKLQLLVDYLEPLDQAV